MAALDIVSSALKALVARHAEALMSRVDLA